MLLYTSRCSNVLLTHGALYCWAKTHALLFPCKSCWRETFIVAILREMGGIVWSWHPSVGVVLFVSFAHNKCVCVCECFFFLYCTMYIHSCGLCMHRRRCMATGTRKDERTKKKNYAIEIISIFFCGMLARTLFSFLFSLSLSASFVIFGRTIRGHTDYSGSVKSSKFKEDAQCIRLICWVWQFTGDWINKLMMKRVENHWTLQTFQFYSFRLNGSRRFVLDVHAISIDVVFFLSLVIRFSRLVVFPLCMYAVCRHIFFQLHCVRRAYMVATQYWSYQHNDIKPTVFALHHLLLFLLFSLPFVWRYLVTEEEKIYTVYVFSSSAMVGSARWEADRQIAMTVSFNGHKYVCEPFVRHLRRLLYFTKSLSLFCLSNALTETLTFNLKISVFFFLALLLYFLRSVLFFFCASLYSVWNECFCGHTAHAYYAAIYFVHLNIQCSRQQS